MKDPDVLRMAGYFIMAIIAYHLLKMLLPFLWVGIAGLLFYHCYNQRR